MKKLFSLFSMLILLSSNALPAFTYADSGGNELAIQILTEEVNNVGELFTSGNEYNSEFIEVNDASTFSTNSSNPHIVHDEENGVITVYSQDFSYGVTLQDRNLGAQESGTGELSYGNYYQWGSNIPMTESYINNGINTNNDARGGSEDSNSSANVIVGYDMQNHKATNVENRRGPCEIGYHVPSAGELSELMRLYFDVIGLSEYSIPSSSNTYGYLFKKTDKNYRVITEDLKIPYAGERYTPTGEILSVGSFAGFRTSSPNTDYSSNMGITSRLLKINVRNEVTSSYYDKRDIGFNVRCFKNDYIRHPKTITYNPNGGAFSGMDVNETKEYTYQYSGTEIIPIYNIQIPDRETDDMSQQSGWMFAGWYTTATNQTIEFDPATSTTDVAYAKWLPFDDLVITMGDKTFTIMDRNMGAKNDDEGIYSNEGNYDNDKIGYYYQWGNNYGFKGGISNSNSITSTIDAHTFEPSTFYNNKYVIRNSNESYLGRDMPVNMNLRGQSEMYDESRKGPCPRGYHIPKEQEWNKVIEIFNNWKSSDECSQFYTNYNFSSSNYCLAKKLRLPYASYIGTNGVYYGDGKTLKYRSSNHETYPANYPESWKINARYFQFRQSDNNIFVGQNFKSQALPLRCFKDEVKKIEYQTYGGNFESTPTNRTTWWGENANTLPTPVKNDGLSIFSGWYTTPNYDENTKVTTTYISSDKEIITLYAKWECESGFTLSDDLSSCNPNVGVLKSNDGKGNEAIISRYVTNNSFINNGYEFIGWNTESDGNGTTYKSGDIINESGLVLFAQWKALEEKAQETTAENVVYTNTTKVTVGGETTEEVLSGSTTLTLVSKEVEDKDVKKEEDTTKVQESEIKVTSDKTVEYEGGLEVYLEKTEDTGTEVKTGKVEGTIKFSAPVAVKIPISSEAEYVKVQVKHGDEDFGFKGLTLNPVNECNNGEAVNDKYQGENIEVKSNNGDKYATIYTCSASTFVAYTENKKPIEPQPSAGGGRTIVSTKNEIKTLDQEHNSANLEKTTVKENTEAVNKTVDTQSVEGKVKKIEGRSLTRGEVAVMTNILLDVYPQLTENRELNEISEACENYADEQNFTKDEKKAITRLCKLSIMGIHADDNRPLEEFLVNNGSTNDEFSKVINRSLSTYTEKDFSVVKDALKKLEGDEENVVFGTVYDVFMGIKNIFSK